MSEPSSDRLVSILEHFSLKARVFHTGKLCHSAGFDATDGVGYIHLLKQGDLKIETAGQPATVLSEPSLLFYMNPTTHRLRPQTDNVELVCASFDFATQLKNPLAQALPQILVMPMARAPALQVSLDLLFAEAQTHRCGQQAILNRLIETIIIQLLRELIEQQHLKAGLLAGLAEPQLCKAITSMHNQPAVSWTLEALAQVAGMSRARFASRFREIVGTTPGNYLSEWRISIAQTLLRQGKPMPYIADAVGYANASALSRAFTTIVGTAPARWKKLNS